MLAVHDFAVSRRSHRRLLYPLALMLGLVAVLALVALMGVPVASARSQGYSRLRQISHVRLGNGQPGNGHRGDGHPGNGNPGVGNPGGSYPGKGRPGGGQPNPGHPIYLALGDSLAFGYSEAKFHELESEGEPVSAYETGYVNDFARGLGLFEPGVQVVNDGCPGETTESLIVGPCAYGLAYPLHHEYSGSQLSDALSVIAAHPGAVSPITLDIGANDALGVIEGTCEKEIVCIEEHVPALFEHIAGNLGYILTQLRTAAPQAKIIVLGLYNPFGERITGADALTVKLNELESSVAASVGARFADPLPVFNPPGALEAPTLCALTNMCTPYEDIHPTDLGYAVLGGLIFNQYLQF
jgi:lysophospholipase L1-like esterase